MGASDAQSVLDAAVEAMKRGCDVPRSRLDALPYPVYAIDAAGLLTYCNPACSEFSGREPQLGADRWSILWRMLTTADEPLPHDRCPMAIAVKERRPVRDAVIIALRPDGSRKAFTPFPTPLFGKDGALVGAVNLLLDVSKQQVEALRNQSERCHRLAVSVADRRARQLLTAMADGYRRNALALTI